MKKSDIPRNEIAWLGGALLHEPATDIYLLVRFGDGTNDPNDDREEALVDPFDDYLMVDLYLHGKNVRRIGFEKCHLDDGYMIPIHRREHPSGQLKDWMAKVCEVACFDMKELVYVSDGEEAY